MRGHMASLFVLGFGLAATLVTAPPARAQGQVHAPDHVGAPAAPGTPSAYGFRQHGTGIKLDVASLNNSGITGTVTLRDLGGDKLEVDVLLNGAGAGPLPIHIHEGACADLNPIPNTPLRTVSNGASTTELDGSLRQLAATPYAIFLHKSPEELPIFVACADITLADQLSAVPSVGEAGPLADLATGLTSAGLALVAGGYALRHRARALMRRGAR